MNIWTKISDIRYVSEASQAQHIAQENGGRVPLPNGLGTIPFNLFARKGTGDDRTYETTIKGVTYVLLNT
jgi:hypothetical protein